MEVTYKALDMRLASFFRREETSTDYFGRSPSMAARPLSAYHSEKLFLKVKHHFSTRDVVTCRYLK